jgi:hypothetical protein
MEGTCCGLILGSIPEFSWNDWGEPRKTSVGIADFRADVGTWDLPNTKEVC